MMITLEEFKETLDEDEFVLGDSFWLQGTRRRFAFTVTDVDPFEWSSAYTAYLFPELRELVELTRSAKGKHRITSRQLIKDFADIPDELVPQLPPCVRTVRDLCKAIKQFVRAKK